MKTHRVTMTSKQLETWHALEAEQAQLQQRLTGFVLAVAGSGDLAPPFGNPRVEVKDGVIVMLIDTQDADEKKEEPVKGRLKRA